MDCIASFFYPWKKVWGKWWALWHTINDGSQPWASSCTMKNYCQQTCNWKNRKFSQIHEHES